MPPPKQNTVPVTCPHCGHVQPEPRGAYSTVGEVVLKGKFIGKLIAERSLEIHSTAQIKGTFATGRLVIPLGTRFRWPEPLRIGGAEIGGEVVANLQSTGTVTLKSTGIL